MTRKLLKLDNKFANKFVYILYICDCIMEQRIDILKGIRPGKIISHELQRRGISQRAFAASIGEHSQTLNAVITGRRNLTTEMAVKIEKSMGYEEGFLLTLQAFYSIAEYKNKMATASVTGIPNVRRALFWDTDFDNIDWGRYKEAAIRRVLERGDETEKAEIARFYHIPISELNNYTANNSYRIKRQNGKR